MSDKHVDFPCLNIAEKCLSSKQCKIALRGYCEIFKKVCHRLMSKYNILSLRDKDMFFSMLFEKVVISLDNLKIDNKSGFYNLSLQIGHNIYVDLLNKQEKNKSKEINFTDLFMFENDKNKRYDFERSIKINRDNFLYDQQEKFLLKYILNILQKIEYRDKCAKLILYWYDKIKEGLNQKEMAYQLKMKENTFNQKLRRCFKKLKKIFQKGD